ncbi:MAG TPA: 50S ribosomal protein L17 [Candidatus Omnitrophica bacterium]|nr:50S ribosomal protein L17 [Candidatus Omnitrophota bacterium]
MRHRKKKSRLSRSRSQRQALLAAISRSIILNGRINTTKERAKNAKRLIDRLISLGKAGSLAAKRRAYKILPDHKLISRLFNEVAPKFKTRAGGYTRIILTSKRRGDNAQMVLLELVEVIGTPKSKTTKQDNIKQVAQTKTKIETPAKKISVADKDESLKVSEKSKPTPEKNKKDESKEVQDKKKPSKKFIGGLRRFFKKERDSL